MNPFLFVVNFHSHKKMDRPKTEFFKEFLENEHPQLETNHESVENLD